MVEVSRHPLSGWERVKVARRGGHNPRTGETEPYIYVHIRRLRAWRWQWRLVAAGRPVYGPRRALTEDLAWARGVCAAQHPAVIAAACAAARRQERP